MGTIKVDFQKISDQANKLEVISESLKKTAQKDYSNAIGNLSTVWKSESAVQFIGKADVLKSRMEETAAEIKKIAEDMRRTARMIYEAEKKAEEISELRKYSGK